METDKMVKCKHGGQFISPDYRKILCEVHQGREDNHQEYIKISSIDSQLKILLDQLEMMLINFQTCLALVKTFLMERKVLKIDFDDLNKFYDDLK
jgi:hypothetical protein